MDTIRFERIIVRNYQAWICAKILINGTPLLETVCDYENSHISYNRGYTPAYQHNFSAYLYKQMENIPLRKRKVCLFICTCMVEECGSFYANLHRTKRNVIMSRFGNPQLAKVREHNDIDYTKFGKYTFDKEEFFSEVEKLRAFSPLGEYHIAWNAPD